MEATTQSKIGRPKGSRQEATRSDAVKRVREALGMTQEEFARAMNSSIATIRRYEQGQLLPGGVAQKAAFAKVAKKAGISIEKEVTP